MKNFLLFDQSTPPRKPDGPQDIQDGDDITPLTLHPKDNVRTPEGRMLHR